jgi:hypothetical protein
MRIINFHTGLQHPRWKHTQHLNNHLNESSTVPGIDKMAAFVMTSPSFFRQYPDELTVFLLELTVLVPQGFVNGTFKKFIEVDFAKYNTSALVVLGMEVSDPKSKDKFDAAVKSEILHMLEGVVECVETDQENVLLKNNLIEVLDGRSAVTEQVPGLLG